MGEQEGRLCRWKPGSLRSLISELAARLLFYVPCSLEVRPGDPADTQWDDHQEVGDLVT